MHPKKIEEQMEELARDIAKDSLTASKAHYLVRSLDDADGGSREESLDYRVIYLHQLDHYLVRLARIVGSAGQPEPADSDKPKWHSPLKWFRK